MNNIFGSSSEGGGEEDIWSAIMKVSPKDLIVIL